jgi:NAD(P)-dependent dehydrogenase (short-subunit alcohol dehydrogenase family)
MKVVLVTGGNRGIGLEICRQLDSLGHTVILGSRDLQKGLASAGSLSRNVLVRQLDVTDENSILDIYESVKAEFGRLDVLVNNAGIGEHPEENKNSPLARAKNYMEENIYGVRQINKIIVPLMRKTGLAPQRNSASDIPLSLADHVMATNLYGPWRMIQVFIPLLMKSDDPRIINMSSGMGELKSLTGFYPAYSLSKTALNALTIMFSNELKPRGIKVNSMCPGWVRTDMGGPNAPRHVSQGADTAVWLATEKEIPTGKFFRDRKEIDW